MFSNTQLKFVSNSKLFQLAKESRERNNIEHKNYLLNYQRNQKENFFVIKEFTIEINIPFRKGNQETVEETMEEFHKPKKTDIYKENKLNNIDMQSYHLLRETLSFQKPISTEIS